MGNVKTSYLLSAIFSTAGTIAMSAIMHWRVAAAHGMTSGHLSETDVAIAGTGTLLFAILYPLVIAVIKHSSEITDRAASVAGARGNLVATLFALSTHVGDQGLVYVSIGMIYGIFAAFMVLRQELDDHVGGALMLFTVMAQIIASTSFI